MQHNLRRAGHHLKDLLKALERIALRPLEVNGKNPNRILRIPDNRQCRNCPHIHNGHNMLQDRFLTANTCRLQQYGNGLNRNIH